MVVQCFLVVVQCFSLLHIHMPMSYELLHSATFINEVLCFTGHIQALKQQAITVSPLSPLAGAHNLLCY